MNTWGKGKDSVASQSRSWFSGSCFSIVYGSNPLGIYHPYKTVLAPDRIVVFKLQQKNFLFFQIFTLVSGVA